MCRDAEYVSCNDTSYDVCSRDICSDDVCDCGESESAKVIIMIVSIPSAFIGCILLPILNCTLKFGLPCNGWSVLLMYFLGAAGGIFVGIFLGGFFRCLEISAITMIVLCSYPTVCSIYTIRNIPYVINSIGHSISRCTSWLCGATIDSVRNIPDAISSIRQPINRHISSLGNLANRGINNLARALGGWGNAVSSHCSSLVRLARFRNRNEPDISTSVEPDIEEPSEITTSSSAVEPISRTPSFASLMNPYSTFYRPQIKQLPNLTQQMQPQSSRRLNFANLMNPYSFFGASNQETNTSVSAHSETLEDISLSITK